MIPLRLELKNFLSYGEIHPALVLEGIHVACLSGPNGHGKSALLDAMVWAVWGEARGGARAGDDLMRSGAREMEVSLVFEAAGTRYRVTRKRVARARTGSGSLHFESFDGEQWRSLAGHSMADTQRIIDETLRMNHKTFVHASFIAQGRADAFMTLTPQERKQVLGDILDLQQYDLLATSARQEARTAQDEAARLKAQIDAIDKTLEQRAAAEARVREAERDEREAGLLTERVAAERAALQSELARLESLEQLLRSKQEELRRAEQRAHSFAARLKDLNTRLSAARILMIKADAIDRAYQEFQRLDQEDRELRDKYEAWCTAREDVDALVSQIDRERAKLAADLQSCSSLATQLAVGIERLPEDRAALERARGELGRLNLAEERRSEAQQRLVAARDELAGRAQEGKRLKEERAEFPTRLQLLGEHQVCPVCGQQLGKEGLADARRHLQTEQARVDVALKKIVVEYRAQEAQVKGLQDQLDQLETELERRSNVDRAVGVLEARIERAEADERKLVDARAEEADLMGILGREDFAHELRAQKREAERLLAGVGYDQERHRTVREARDRLRTAPEEMRKLDGARVILETGETDVADLEAQCKQTEAELATLRPEAANLEQEVRDLPGARTALASKENELQHVSALHLKAREDVGHARQEVVGLDIQQAERERLVPLRQAALDDASAYQQLAEAFGKSGIQEMIIDEALPEIEELANELLSRLSEGRMRVSLTTQREGRTGGNISTLDVNVSDELGTRPYELFSGGEKFRINFAIRIALSRMLARRAGVPLQMLAIDEGFGSQDREGCDRLIEAIRTVQDDFERILVITHLEEIKDAFPVRIEVTKTPQGSTFSFT